MNLPGSSKTRPRQIAGNALLYILLVVVVVGAAAFLHLRARARSCCGSPANTCINNLRLIDGATQQWALENRKGTNDVPQWSEVTPYMGKAGAVVSCPLGGKYTLGSISGTPTCSIPGHKLP